MLLYTSVSSRSCFVDQLVLSSSSITTNLKDVFNFKKDNVYKIIPVEIIQVLS